jgi:hypothetical protein
LCRKRKEDVGMGIIITVIGTSKNRSLGVQKGKRNGVKERI